MENYATKELDCARCSHGAFLSADLMIRCLGCHLIIADCNCKPEPRFWEGEVSKNRLEAGQEIECGWKADTGDICESVSYTVERFSDGPYMLCSDCGESRKIIIVQTQCARCGQLLRDPEYTTTLVKDGQSLAYHDEPDRPCYQMAIARAADDACFDCWSSDINDYGCAWEIQGCACDCHKDEQPQDATATEEPRLHFQGDGCAEYEFTGVVPMPSGCHHCCDPLVNAPHKAFVSNGFAYWYHIFPGPDCYAAALHS